MSTLGTAVWTGAVGSLVASLIWLLGLRRLKPRLDLSPVVAEETRDLRGNERITYSIKMINRRKRAAVDLQFELVMIRPRRTRGGFVDTRTLLRVYGRPPLILPRYENKAGEHHNAYRLRTGAELRVLLQEDPNASIRLRVMARDEVSGIGKVFEAKYNEPASDIQRGKFARGQTFDIVPE